MKKLAILLLAAILAACSSAPTAAPTEPPAPTVVESSPTPVVVVQTVIVEATQAPTEVPPTAVPPTEVPPTPVVVTVVVEASPQAVAPTTAPADSNNGLITIDNNLGAGWFTNITLTKNALSLRCQLNREITFSVKPADPNITEVNFFYRIEDRATGATFDWQSVGRMFPDTNGNFTLVFSGEDVSANFRKPNAWLDFQFVGLSRTGGVVGRSEKIEQQVTYTLDCP